MQAILRRIRPSQQSAEGVYTALQSHHRPHCIKSPWSDQVCRPLDPLPHLSASSESAPLCKAHTSGTWRPRSLLVTADIN